MIKFYFLPFHMAVDILQHGSKFRETTEIFLCKECGCKFLDDGRWLEATGEYKVTPCPECDKLASKNTIKCEHVRNQDGYGIAKCHLCGKCYEAPVDKIDKARSKFMPVFGFVPGLLYDDGEHPAELRTRFRQAIEDNPSNMEKAWLQFNNSYSNNIYDGFIKAFNS